MKKVLFIAPLDSKGRFVGGVYSYAKSILDSSFFVEQGIDFHGLSTCLVNRGAFSGGQFKFENIINFFKLKKKINQTLKNNQFDLIYINSSRKYALLKDLLLFKRKHLKKHKLILHIHFADIDNVLPNNRFIKKLTLGLIKKKVTKLIVLSSELKKAFESNGVKEDRISVLYNYYDSKLPSVSPSFLDKKNNTRILKFIFMGSITKRKGIHDILDVFSSSKTKNVELLVCGEPNNKEGFELVKEYSKFENIFFKGYADWDAKISAYLEANVFILPSYAEGLPISILEALHFGLPVISTPVGAIKEIIEKQNGILINPGDRKGLLNAIQQYKNNPNLLREQSINNLSYSKKFDFETFSMKLVGILNQI